MKVIALMLVKNEDWILDYTLTCLRGFVDKIIVLDDRSTDSTLDLLSKHPVTVMKGTIACNKGRKRSELLRAGRKDGGTHFVWLDADEVFTADLRDDFRGLLKTMVPGQKILLRWLAMWKSPFVFRDDESVWSNNFKDFVFCDDHVSDFEQTWTAEDLKKWGEFLVAATHEPRTPGENKPSNIIRLETYGGVMHYQFAPWERFQAKQKWYRYLELIRNPNSATEIIARYRITEDDPSARVSPIKSSWINGYSVPCGIEGVKPGWFLTEIQKMDERFGKDFFSVLNKKESKKKIAVRRILRKLGDII